MGGVQDVGEKLVGEVEETSLGELLLELRSYIQPTTSSSSSFTHFTGIDPIDHLLDTFHTSKTRPGQAENEHTRWKQPPTPCIEISSPGSSDGKSQLMYLMLAVMALPCLEQGPGLHGQQAAVLFFDADGHFDVSRLYEVMRSLMTLKANRSDARPTWNVTEAIIHNALQHVHVFRPQSMTALLASLQDVPDYLFSSGAHQSFQRRVAAVMIDSATAFYWNDRDDSETRKVAGQKEEQHTLNSPAAYTVLRRLLSGLGSRLSCPVIYTAANLFHKFDPECDRALASSLPGSWSHFPTLRLIVQRKPVRRLPIAVSAEEASRDAECRAEAVSEGAFRVFVNGDACEQWSRDVKAALQTGGTSGSFGMVADGRGIVLVDVDQKL